jgi:transposase
MARTPYPSDVSDEEWALVVPYLTVMTEGTPRWEYSPRELFIGVRWIVRTGAAGRMMAHDLSPWGAVYLQAQCWRKAKVFAAMVGDLRAVLRVVQGLLVDTPA